MCARHEHNSTIVCISSRARGQIAAHSAASLYPSRCWIGSRCGREQHHKYSSTECRNTVHWFGPEYQRGGCTPTQPWAQQARLRRRMHSEQRGRTWQTPRQASDTCQAKAESDVINERQIKLKVRSAGVGAAHLVCKQRLTRLRTRRLTRLRFDATDSMSVV